ncbi:hypothetical protein [Phaeodactylibacter xiamenensis]|jgi:hypothetical protein|uniref:hypothetical protein n=1 Tax=Phaeodactylibacter xiamenensis TaxID=1524460 RepID=UPI003BAAEAA9
MDQPKRQPKASFSHFLDKFPEVPLPITLAEEAHHAFSQKNDPLPAVMIEQFILPIEGQPMDDYTEFVPCMRIPDTHDFHAIIYWRAMLMSYQYSLVTFNKKGELIDKRVIAGTISQGGTLTTSVATIEDDWKIYIVSGQSQANQNKGFDPAKSTANHLELLPEGQITEHI